MPSTPRHPRHQVTPRARGTSPGQQAAWRAHHHHPLTPAEQAAALAYAGAIAACPAWDDSTYPRLARAMARAGHPVLSKARLRRALLALPGDAAISAALGRLQTKPIRTLSGVAPITVLTAPRVCPGRCIFCPDEVRMPRSYLSNEPGAMRALMLGFDPYVQVEQRLAALERTGHPAAKAELLVLGGTWSDYPRPYQETFIRRLFDALNGGPPAATVEEAHRRNELAAHRCTGLVIETRPDFVTLDEVHWLRRLGVTRVQMGAQSLNDRILARNGRGHDVQAVRQAVRLLRSAGIKVALHMMPNLLGATPETDLADWERLFADPGLRPDEAKLYPTGLIRGTPLYDIYLRGDYRPYTEAELIDLLMACKRLTPIYCRLNRVMRDIPAPDIAAGVTASNLRQVVQERLREAGTPCRCIRCREVRSRPVEAADVNLEPLEYVTDHSREVFLSAVTPDDQLAGFLRLSLPQSPAPLAEIDGAALIRQVQVYGPALAPGEESDGQAQHQGLGRRLIACARQIAQRSGYRRLAVIAAAGTRDYYRQQGFELEDLYMAMSL